MPCKLQCGHKVLVFGCQVCIHSVERARFENWCKTFKFPKCERCMGPTKAFMYNKRADKMSALVGCASLEADGPETCSDLDYEIEIK